MTTTKKALSILGIAALIAIISGASFVFGYFNALKDHNVDMFELNVDKYVKLKESLIITNHDSQDSITLPKGTVLYYKGVNVKNTVAQACLRVTEEASVLEDRVEYISEPGSYYMNISKDERDAYEPKF